MRLITSHILRLCGSGRRVVVFQGLEQKPNLGGHFGAVARPGSRSPATIAWRTEIKPSTIAGRLVADSLFLEEGHGGGRVASLQVLAHSEDESTRVRVILTRRHDGRPHRQSPPWSWLLPRPGDCLRLSRSWQGWPKKSKARLRGRIGPCSRLPAGSHRAHHQAARAGAGSSRDCSALRLPWPSPSSANLSAARWWKVTASSGRSSGPRYRFPN